MATATSVSATHNVEIDGLLSGTKWTGTITYSFPDSSSYYKTPYSSANEPTSGFHQAPTQMQSAINYAVGLINGYTNANIQYAGTGSSDIMVAQSSAANPTSYAYYPSSGAGGDVWFGTAYDYSQASPGNYYFQTALHEFGHALGLKHSQETGGVANVALPTDHDNLEYTVMSYRSYAGASSSGGYTNEAYGYSTTYMANDILALQTMYGANYSLSGQSITYTWSPTTGQEFINGVGQPAPGGGKGGSANRIFETIWNEGATATYDLSNYTTDLTINLNPGAYSVFSTAQLAYLGNGHYAAGNVYNAYLYNDDPRSYIANAIGGSGNNTIIGNAAANVLKGGSGNNTFTGGGGDDTIIGGGGINTAVYSGNKADYAISYNANTQTFTISDQRSGSPDGTDTVTGVQYFQFADGTVASATLITQPGPAPKTPVIASLLTDSGVPGDNITNVNTPTLKGTADANSTVTVYDGSTKVGTVTADASGAWSLTTSKLADGSHSLTATATTAGGTSNASTAFTVTIDTVAPDAPTVAASTPTSDHVEVLSGTAEANSTVTIFDGAIKLGTVTADAHGAWSYTTEALAVGSHSFTATATDVAGNTSATSSTATVAIAAPPATPVIASFSDESGVPGDHITNHDTLTLTGTADANSTVAVYDGSTQVGTATADASGAWSLTTSKLADGSHSLTATASTDGGTSNASMPFAVTIDTVAPDAPTIAASTPASDHVEVLSGTAEANSTVTIFDGITKLGTVTADADGAWSYTTDALAVGSHSFTATATDVAGNTGTASSTETVTIGAPSTTPVISDDTGDHITNHDTLTLTGTADANSTVAVFDGSTQIGTATADANGAWSLTTSKLADGNHSLTATATTDGGTSDASTPLTVTIDTVAPDAPTIATSTPDNNHVDVLIGTAEANSTVTIFDGATKLGTVTADADGVWSYTTEALAVGSHNFTATATDVAGNTSTVSSEATVTIAGPSTTPVITSFSDDTGDHITNHDTLTLTGTADANSTVAVYDGSTQVGTATADASGAWSLTTSKLADGSHSLTATATTSEGTSDASIPLTVTIDTVAPDAPTIATSTPGNNHVDVLIGTAEANSTVTVFDGATKLGTVTADADGVWSYTTDALAVGSHSFTATATDIAGNTSTVSSEATVTIAGPSTTPVITSFSDDTGDHITNHDTLTLTGTADANSTVAVFDGSTQIGTATADANGAWSLTTSKLADGSHSLTATATTSEGTSDASTPFAVTIDTVAPDAPTIAASTPGSNHVDVLTGTAEANSTVTVFDGATKLGTVTADADGAWSYTTKALSVGSHNFTATAMDVAGNTSDSSATATVNVKGTVGTDLTSFLHNVLTHLDSDLHKVSQLFDQLHTSKAQATDSSGHTADSGGAIPGPGNTLTGAVGGDIGSSHSDTFVFASNFGHDIINNFTASGSGHDTIQFSKSALSDFASVLNHASQVGHDVVLTHADDSLTLKNTKLGALHNSDFHFA